MAEAAAKGLPQLSAGGRGNHSSGISEGDRPSIRAALIRSWQAYCSRAAAFFPRFWAL